MNNSERPIEKRNFRVSEFTAAYGISRTKLYMEVAAGRLRTFKCGRTTLISREAAEQWQHLNESGGAV